MPVDQQPCTTAFCEVLLVDRHDFTSEECIDESRFASI
jgi:hypothetical protein